MTDLVLFALLKKYIDNAIGSGTGGDVADLEKILKKLPRIHRFSQSSVSSAFSGPAAILDKSDLTNPEAELLVGDAVIFPDNKSLVLYLGTITEINGSYITVGEVTYLKDSWQFYGDWISGVHASYPEVYRYEGGSWLCLVCDTETAPTEGKEWRLLTVKVPEAFRPTYYKLNGDALEDLGVDQIYLVANANLIPSTPSPKVGDIVILYTNNSTYLGEITATNVNGALVQAKVKLGTILPEPTEADNNKVLGVQDGKLTYIDK